MQTHSAVVLSVEQRAELSMIAQSRSLPAGYVFRARLILMLSEGASYLAIQQQLRTTAPTIIRWKTRFLEGGMDGLDTHHPGQPASMLTAACVPESCRRRGRSREMDRPTGVVANWRRPWV